MTIRIGIDFGGTKIQGLAIDEEGRELSSNRIATPRHDYEKSLIAIQEMVTTLEAAIGKKADGIGIGTPGSSSVKTGLMKNSNSTWLLGKPLEQDLRKIFGDRVRIAANDANCFVKSEATDGAAAGAKNVFGAILGTGVGGGIVWNGELVNGENRIAGEWGHNPLPWPKSDELPGQSCYCGNMGCIETFLSGPGFSRQHYLLSKQECSAEQIVADAKDPKSEAAASLRRYEDRLARALAGVINCLDPEVIVLGGGLSLIESLYENVPKLWTPYIFSDEVSTRLVPAKFGSASGVRGAAWLW